VPVPFPSDDDVLLTPPDAAEADVLARGVIGAVTPPDGLTPLQDILVQAMFEAMTGHLVTPRDVEPLGCAEFAEALANRNEMFRHRIVQVMLLGALVLSPLPEAVASQVEAYARELGVDDGMLRVAHRYASGSLGLALIDFNRNGYTADWDAARSTQLHTAKALDDAWDMAPHDPELAARWAALEGCAPGTLGRRVWEFYRARGFTFPGLPGSAPPYLAQHDWVHVVADYGTTVESELEVFGLVGRAIPDPRGFSLLAMVVSLFETGQLHHAAGLFEYDRGHLSHSGMAARLADAMYRGARCGRDLLAVDWFAYADLEVEHVRVELGIPVKWERIAPARRSHSPGPWEPGGISPYQLDSGQRLAAAEGRDYDAHGACVA
jgi:hypothetical protein